MTSSKIAVTIPVKLLKLAKQQIEAGRAESMSALVSDALNAKLCRDQLDDILDAMGRDHGNPGKAAERWAKRVLGRVS